MKNSPLLPAASILVVLGLVALLVTAPAALADAISPESGGSSNADSTDALYKFVLYVAVAVFVLVEGALLTAAFRFRKRQDSQEPIPIVGNAHLELGWTAAAASILVVLAVATFVKLGDIEDPPDGPLPGPKQAGIGASQPTDSVKTAGNGGGQPPSGRRITIQVAGQQFLWRYTYPDGNFSYYELVVPEDTVVVLRLTATDVAHSWWIPKLGGKKDALPGYEQSTWFRADRPALYEGQCAELCGNQHANMRARVRVVTRGEYGNWLRQNKLAIDAAKRDLKRLKAIYGPDGPQGGGAS